MAQNPLSLFPSDLTASSSEDLPDRRPHPRIPLIPTAALTARTPPPPPPGPGGSRWTPAHPTPHLAACSAALHPTPRPARSPPAPRRRVPPPPPGPLPAPPPPPPTLHPPPAAPPPHPPPSVAPPPRAPTPRPPTPSPRLDRTDFDPTTTTIMFPITDHGRATPLCGSRSQPRPGHPPPFPRPAGARPPGRGPAHLPPRLGDQNSTGSTKLHYSPPGNTLTPHRQTRTARLVEHGGPPAPGPGGPPRPPRGAAVGASSSTSHPVPPHTQSSPTTDRITVPLGTVHPRIPRSPLRQGVGPVPPTPGRGAPRSAQPLRGAPPPRAGGGGPGLPGPHHTPQRPAPSFPHGAALPPTP